MNNLAKMVRRTTLALLLTAVASKAQSPAPAPPPDQRSRQCGGINYVGGATANPFSAKRVTKSTTTLPDGTHKSIERVEPVARDSDGRIRFEKFTCADSDCNEHKVTLHTRDGGTIETTRQILGIVIEVFACPDSMLIQIRPGMRIARITRGYPTALPPNRVRRPYSAIVTQLLSGKPQPNIVVEDLGFRTIDGISARGVRLTHLGAETDGEWSGKPIRITETWASDDIAATILEIRTDPKTHMASVNTLTDIKRVDPDPTIFEIPQGYKINPTADEMPYQLADAGSAETNPQK
jgi:hypothetical protein